jgi:hypothetical protein
MTLGKSYGRRLNRLTSIRFARGNERIRPMLASEIRSTGLFWVFKLLFFSE